MAIEQYNPRFWEQLVTIDGAEIDISRTPTGVSILTSRFPEIEEQVYESAVLSIGDAPMLTAAHSLEVPDTATVVVDPIADILSVEILKCLDAGNLHGVTTVINRFANGAILKRPHHYHNRYDRIPSPHLMEVVAEAYKQLHARLQQRGSSLYVLSENAQTLPIKKPEDAAYDLIRWYFPYPSQQPTNQHVLRKALTLLAPKSEVSPKVLNTDTFVGKPSIEIVTENQRVLNMVQHCIQEHNQAINNNEGNGNLMVVITDVLTPNQVDPLSLYDVLAQYYAPKSPRLRMIIQRLSDHIQ